MTAHRNKTTWIFFTELITVHYGIAFSMKDTCGDYVGNSVGLGADHMCAIKCILRDLTFKWP